jgi:nicotinate (nicotinamide) nucleotide adenylyltransferase
MGERRIDPDDGQPYTWNEFRSYYAQTYKEKWIEAYWMSCRVVEPKPKATAAVADKFQLKKRPSRAGELRQKAKRRVAVLGGSFDPPQVNHLICAAEVIHARAVDEVWIVPCGFRSDKPNLSPAHVRYTMCQLSVCTFYTSDMPIKVSDINVYSEDKSSTYDLLQALQKKHPNMVFSFIIGTDWLQPGTDIREWCSTDPETGLETLRTGEKLLNSYDFIVIPRPGYTVKDVTAFGPRMKLLTMPDGVNLMEGSLSSTEVRKRTDASNQARLGVGLIEGLVTPSCLSYIHKHSLYCMNVRPQGPRKVAVFGGVFDPPTNSHMISLADIIQSGMADEVIIVPCGARVDKPEINPAIHRYLMCEVAVNSHFSLNAQIFASDIEVMEKEALSTYDLLTRLKAQRPECEFMFVIGTDWLQPGADFRKWVSKDPTGETISGEKLLQEFDIIVFKRPGFDVVDITEFGPRMQWMVMPYGMKKIDLNLTSTEVRNRARLSYSRKDHIETMQPTLQSLDGLVPPGVLTYIKRENLYTM